MTKRAKKLILTLCAYGGLVLSIVFYVMINTASSQYYGLGLSGFRMAIITGFIAAIVALLANIIIVTQYKNRLRYLSIIAILLSLAIIGLLIVPLAFTVGSY